MKPNMDEPIEEQIRKTSHAVEPAPAFREALWENIITNAEKRADRRPFWQRIFTQPAWVTGMAVLIVAVVVALMGPQNVAAAFQGWLRYLPGIGFVQSDNGIGYIGSMTAGEKDGVRWVIDQAVADSTQTVVAFHLEGLPEGQQGSCMYDQNILTVNGRQYPPMGGESSGDAGKFTSRIVFQALPKDVKEAQFSIGMLAPDGCPAPKDWQTTLHFGPLPANVTLAAVTEQKPVDENSTAAPAAGDTTKTAAAADEANPSTADKPAPQDAVALKGIQLNVEKTVELADGYILSGSIAWQDDPASKVSLQDIFPDTSTMELVDADGQRVPFQAANEAMDSQHWGIQVLSKNFRGPLTLTTHNLLVDAQPKDMGFQFDAGNTPALDQRWEINQTLQVLGQTVKILNAQAIAEPLEHHFGMSPSATEAAKPDQAGAVNGFAFEIQTGSNIQNLGLAQSPLNRDSFEEASRAADGTYRLKMVYLKGAPTGTLQYQISQILVNLAGDWQTTVDLNVK